MARSFQEQSEARLQQYWHMVRQNKWWVFFLTIGFTVASAALISFLPDQYTASASILVDPQRVPDDPGSGPGPARSSPVGDRLRATAQEILLSAPRLQDIIVKYRLDSELRNSGFLPLLRWIRSPLSEEEIIDVMRKRVEITVKQSGTNAPVTVELTYEGSDPAAVAQVTNELITQLIEWNVQARQQQTSGIVQFLKDQLNRTKQSLDEQEKMMRDFKVSHAGEMPEDLHTNLQTLTQLRGMYQANNEALDRLSQEYGELTHSAGFAPAGRANQPLTERERLGQEKRDLQDKLKDLQKRYTDSFPEVVETQNRLKQVAEALKQAPETAQAVESASPNASRLEGNRRSVERLNEEQKRLNAQVVVLQQKVDAVPLREQQFSELARNYNITKQDYQNLFQKEAQAEMTASLEKEQGADRFVILEPARPPERPSKPKRAVLLSAAFFASLLASIGIVVGKERLSTTIMAEEQLAGLLPESVAVLASIPTIEAPGDKTRRRIFAGFAFAVLVSACFLVVVFLRRIHPVL